MSGYVMKVNEEKRNKEALSSWISRSCFLRVSIPVRPLPFRLSLYPSCRSNEIPTELKSLS